MKAHLSGEYYQMYWDKFMQRVPGDQYMNLEADLALEIKPYQAAGIPADALAVIEGMVAAQIIDRADRKCHEQMATIKRIESGEASFGHVNRSQEIRARAEFRQRFEFNCYQLSVFRKKYERSI